MTSQTIIHWWCKRGAVGGCIAVKTNVDSKKVLILPTIFQMQAFDLPFPLPVRCFKGNSRISTLEFTKFPVIATITTRWWTTCDTISVNFSPLDMEYLILLLIIIRPGQIIRDTRSHKQNIQGTQRRSHDSKMKYHLIYLLIWLIVHNWSSLLFVSINYCFDGNGNHQHRTNSGNRLILPL